MDYGYRRNILVMDIECYINYFLVAFRDVENPEKTKHFEMRGEKAKLDIEGIKRFLRLATIVTFNGNNYDIPMLMYALQGKTCSELKDASDTIIEHKMRGWQFQKEFNCQSPAYLDHIDIFEIPVGTLSLKAYAARIGCEKLQDLPIEPHEVLTPAQMDAIAEYCDNDTTNTRQLFTYKKIKPRIDLRIDISREYGMDMRSKSDAQIGEAVFKATIERTTKRKVYRPDIHTIKKRFKYDIPEFITFEHPSLKALLDTVRDTVFHIGDYGHVKMPAELSDLKISIGQARYTLGIGGLHSNEESQTVVAKEGWFICDADVGSYYPSIIINGRYYPAHLGEVFLKIYQKFRDDRLAMKDFADLAKKKGIEAALKAHLKEDWSKLPLDKIKIIIEVFKIVLNGSFGKLASMYSFLYSPKMMLQVTLTGQLCLLMLIERLEAAGLRIISANTDGIVIYGRDSQKGDVRRIIDIWEVETGFLMEYTHYEAIYSQSVNSYLARKSDGEWKRKGDYSERDISQTGNGQVCIEAVMAYLSEGTPLRETIEGCTDFIKFTNFQQVTGGAYKDGMYLGKVVRWYYSTETETPILNKRGGTVPLTRGAEPCMQLPKVFPDDVDYDWYVREAHAMLERLGVGDVEREGRAFGLQEGVAPKWGRKEGQATFHLIDMGTKDALCEARLKNRHDDWVYEQPPTGARVCGKCKKKCENL